MLASAGEMAAKSSAGARQPSLEWRSVSCRLTARLFRYFSHVVCCPVFLNFVAREFQVGGWHDLRIASFPYIVAKSRFDVVGCHQFIVGKVAGSYDPTGYPNGLPLLAALDIE